MNIWWYFCTISMGIPLNSKKVLTNEISSIKDQYQNIQWEKLSKDYLPWKLMHTNFHFLKISDRKHSLKEHEKGDVEWHSGS
jgi:hypothetical protein